VFYALDDIFPDLLDFLGRLHLQAEVLNFKLIGGLGRCQSPNINVGNKSDGRNGLGCAAYGLGWTAPWQRC